MRKLRMFIFKETLHILRDRRTLLIIIGLPIIQIILFGFAITNEINDARIAILDPSQDVVSHELTQRLISSGYFLLEEEIATIAEAEHLFRRGAIQMAVVFPSGFQERFYRDPSVKVQILADATEPNTATTLLNYASGIINAYQREKLGLEEMPLQIKTEMRMLYNQELKSVFMFVPGVMTIILMLVSAMMTSIALTREKELGTMEVLLASPLRPALIIAGKVIPYIILSLMNTGVILLLGVTVFEMPIRGSLLLLGLESALFVMTCLALGIFISTRTNSQMVAMMFSLMALMLPTILLSGFIFPIESMPLVLQWLSNIIPAKWFIIIIKAIMLKGTGMEIVWEETLILGGMLFFFTLISIRNFKIRLA